jgi:flagellar motor protein MotB
MSGKLKITERQLALITNYVIESKKPIGYLTEDVEFINEGFREVVLGVAMLMGLGLTGQNKANAQDALNDAKILQQIDSTLSGPNIKQVADKMESMGLNNAMEVIQNNADEIKRNYASFANKRNIDPKLDLFTTKSQSMVQSKLKRGYAVSDIRLIKSDTILPKGSIVTVTDTIDYSFNSDQFFVTGTYNLRSESIDSLNAVIGDIKDMNGRVVSIVVESSTDTEPIKIGNERLSELRANSVISVISGMDLGEDVVVTKELKPNSGPDVYSTTMSSEERAQARVSTAPYRYVTVKIVAVFDIKVEEPETAPQIINQFEYDLVKVGQATYGTISMKYRGGEKTTRHSVSCEKVKVNKKTLKCPANK